MPSSSAKGVGAFIEGGSRGLDELYELRRGARVYSSLFECCSEAMSRAVTLREQNLRNSGGALCRRPVLSRNAVSAMSSWYSTMTQLGLPNPTLLVGPYSPKTLAPLSSNSFSSSEPLTARLRHADLVLYSLLGFISPLTRATLPSWPPMTLSEAKALRAELSKGVEQILKAEKDSWDEQILWRRSWLDEAKGEKWERCLSALGAVALRRALESKELVGQLPGELPMFLTVPVSLTKISGQISAL